MLRKTQNSGVMVKRDHETGNKNYFGILTNIILLDFFFMRITFFYLNVIGGMLAMKIEDFK